MDAFTADSVKKKMMLERFQEEVGPPPGATTALLVAPLSLSHAPLSLSLFFHYERIYTQNPGFDFSGAEFNGAVPDPQTFMGGVRYT